MGRPKKINQQDLNTDIAKEQNESKALDLRKDEGNNILPLIASEDVTLEKGIINVPTLIKIKDERLGLIVSTYDNARKGLCVENGERLRRSRVVTTTVEKGDTIKVPIFINDDVNVMRNNDFNTRMDKLKIEAGTHIADLILI